MAAPVKKIHSFHSYLRASSMTLPSLGKLPGATNFTSPRNLVMSRTLSAIAAACCAAASMSVVSQCKVMLSLAIPPLTTRRAFRIRASQPAVDARIRAATGRDPRQHGGQIPGAKAYQGIVRVEGGHHDFAHFARRDQIAGARMDDF